MGFGAMVGGFSMEGTFEKAETFGISRVVGRGGNGNNGGLWGDVIILTIAATRVLKYGRNETFVLDEMKSDSLNAKVDTEKFPIAARMNAMTGEFDSLVDTAAKDLLDAGAGLGAFGGDLGVGENVIGGDSLLGLFQKRQGMDNDRVGFA